MKKSVLILACFLIIGCAHQNKVLLDISTFSTNAAPIINNTEKDYNNVSKIHILQEEVVLISNYDKNGYRPGQISNLIDDKDFQIRKNAIDLIRSYIDLIGALSSKSSNQKIDETSQKLKNSLALNNQAVSNFENTYRQGNIFSQNLIRSFTGIDFLVKITINHTVYKRLPKIIKQADPSIQKICSLLIEDLNNLEVQQDNDYLTMLMEQKQFIDSHQFGPVEKQTQLFKLYQIEKDQKQAHDELENDKIALTNLAKTHHELSEEK